MHGPIWLNKHLAVNNSLQDLYKIICDLTRLGEFSMLQHFLTAGAMEFNELKTTLFNNSGLPDIRVSIT